MHVCMLLYHHACTYIQPARKILDSVIIVVVVVIITNTTCAVQGDLLGAWSNQGESSSESGSKRFVTASPGSRQRKRPGKRRLSAIKPLEVILARWASVSWHGGGGGGACWGSAQLAARSVARSSSASALPVAVQPWHIATPTSLPMLTARRSP